MQGHDEEQLYVNALPTNSEQILTIFKVVYHIIKCTFCIQRQYRPVPNRAR